MTIGVVIVSYRCQDLLMQCLESLRAQVPEVLATTVVVDNASGDGTVEALHREWPDVRVIEKARNVGFAGGVNAGMRELAECEVICLLNPDATLEDTGLRAAAAYLREHPEIGVAGGRILNRDGTLQASARAFPGHWNALFNRHSIATKLFPGNRWSSRYLMTDWAHDEVREVDWVSGAFFLVHRRAIEAVGLLDAEFFFSIEDVDYCRRIRDAGMQVVYYPLATVRHRVGGSSRKAVYRAMWAHHAGMWRYYRKHMRHNVGLDVLTAAGIGARFSLHAISYAVRTAKNRLLARENP